MGEEVGLDEDGLRVAGSTTRVGVDEDLDTGVSVLGVGAGRTSDVSSDDLAAPPEAVGANDGETSRPGGGVCSGELVDAAIPSLLVSRSRAAKSYTP